MKTNLDKLFKTNEDYEKNGVWFEISDTTGFLVKPLKPTNPNVKAAFANFYKPYARQIELGTLDDAKAQEIQVKMFVQACLVDWKGVEIDGKVREFDKTLAVEFFLNLPDLFETLWKHCQDFKNYQDEVGNFSADA
jgi:hypothetical protein